MATKSRKPARLGYAAYVRGSNACTGSCAVGGVSLYASASMTFDRVLLCDEDGRVARFATEDEASAAACAARWNNQTFGSVPIAHLKRDEAFAFVDVSGDVVA